MMTKNELIRGSIEWQAKEIKGQLLTLKDADGDWLDQMSLDNMVSIMDRVIDTMTMPAGTMDDYERGIDRSIKIASELTFTPKHRKNVIAQLRRWILDLNQ